MKHPARAGGSETPRRAQPVVRDVAARATFAAIPNPSLRRTRRSGRIRPCPRGTWIPADETFINFTSPNMNKLVFCEQYIQDKKGFLSDEQGYGAISQTELWLQLGKITSGMNREALKSQNGKGLFSYRANDDIRIICYEWNAGEILLLLVDHHDKAYARARQMDIGSERFSPTELPKVVIRETRKIDYVPAPPPCKLSEIPFEKLARLVGSKETAAQLQLVHDEDELLRQLEQIVPVPQTRDDLIDLSSSPGKIDAMLSRPPAEKKRVPVEQALKISESWCLLDEATTEGFMNGTLENWQVFLHPSQRVAVEMGAGGPSMVTGPAGTGKTVVAVHRAKWLLANVFTNGEKILFTTFTKALAKNARDWLRTICPPDMMQRIDVRHLDGFIQPLCENVLHKRIDYGDLPAFIKIHPPLGGKWDERFIYEEFQEIVLEYRIGSLADYRVFQRPSRFGRLAASEREMLWPVFEDMKKQLLRPTCQKIPKVHALNQLSAYFATPMGQTAGREYSAIVVDESQDFGASEYRFFAAYTGNTFDSPVKNSLFLAGDGYQRIYGRSGTFKASGINVVNRSIRLKKCYRSTKAIREFAERLISDVDAKNMDGDIATIRDGESLMDGVPVEEHYFPDDSESMYQYIVDTITRWRERGPKELGNYAILLPVARYGFGPFSKQDRLTKMANEISCRGVPSKPFDGKSDDRPDDAVNVMTMHSSKGLQFHGVVVCLNKWPRKPPKGADSEQKQAILDESKCLLYGAIMRASYRVLLTAGKERPKYLPNISV